MAVENELLQGILYTVINQPQAFPVKKIGERIELYRHFLGLKSFEFCKLFKISQGSYSDIKNNKSLPSATTLAALAKILPAPFTIHWILTGETK